MVETDKKLNADESTLLHEEGKGTFPHRLFSYCYGMQKRARLSNFTAAVYFLVSGYQLLGLLFDSSMYESSSAAASDDAIRLLHYTRIVPLIFELNSGNMYAGSLAGGGAFLLVTLFYCLLALSSRSHCATAGDLLYIFYWLLLVPLLELCLSLAKCPNSLLKTTCYSGTHFGLLAGALALLLLCGIVAILATIVCSPTNGLDDHPFARPQWGHEIVYVLLRLYLCVHVNFVPRTYNVVFLGVMVTYGAYLFSVLINGFTYYCPLMSTVFYAWIFIYVETAGCVGLLMFTEYLGKVVRGTWIVLVSMHIALYVLGYCVSQRRTHLLLSAHRFSTSQQLDLYLHYCDNVFIQHRYKSQFPQDFFEGILLRHKARCIDPLCPLIKRAVEHEAFEAKKAKMRNFIGNYQTKDSANVRHAEQQMDEDEKLQRISDLKFQKDFLLHIGEQQLLLHDAAFLLQFCSLILGLSSNVHRAYLSLHSAEEMDKELLLSFPKHARRLELLDAVRAKAKTLEQYEIPNFGEVLRFEGMLDRLKGLVGQNAIMRDSFWTCLSSDVVNTNILHETGRTIMLQVTEIMALWGNMKNIYDSQKEALTLYSQFLYYVLAEKREAITLQNALDMTVRAHLKCWATGKHSVFADTAAVIVISGSPRNMGRIVKASRHVDAILGYKPEEIEGKSMALFMPRCIAQRHQQFMARCVTDGYHRNDIKELKKSVTPLQHVSIYTFAMDRCGFVFPVYISHQQFYTLKMGMCYMGLIRLEPLGSGTEFILTSVDGHIEGISRGLGLRLHITSDMLVEQRVRMQSVCQQMASDDTIDHYKGFMILTLRFSHEIRTGTASDVGLPIHEGQEMPSAADATLKLECDANKVEYSNGYSLMVFKLTPMDSEESVHISKKALIGLKHIQPEILKSLEHVTLPNRLKCPRFQHPILCPSASARKRPNASRQLERVAPATPSRPVVVEPKPKSEERRDTSRTRFSTGQPLVQNMPSISSPSPGALQAREDIAHNAFEIESYSSVSSRPTQVRTVRAIRQLRLQTNETYFPSFVSRVQLFSGTFCLLVVLIVLANVAVMLYFLIATKQDIPVATYAAKRESAFSYAGRAVQQLAMIDVGVMSGTSERYDYSKVADSGASSYKYYVVTNIRLAVQYVKTNQYLIEAAVSDFATANRIAVNPQNIILYNPTSDTTPTSEESAAVATTSFMTHALKLVALGDSVSEPFSTAYLLNNTYRSFVLPFESAQDAIVRHCEGLLDVQSTATLSFMLAAASICVIFLLVIVPVVSNVSREMDETLQFFLLISKTEVQNQRLRIKRFIELITSSSRTDSAQPGECEDLVPVANKEDNANLKEGAANPDLESLLETEEKLDLKKNSATAKPRKHIQYNGGQKSTIIAIALAVGVVMGLYAGLDVISERIKSCYNFQITELRYLANIARDNAMLLSFLYRYIATAAAGQCAFSGCDTSIKLVGTRERQSLSELIVLHKSQGHFADPAYNQLFHSLTEGDVCGNSAFGSRTGCAEVFGGVAKKGLNVALYYYVEMVNSVYEDFSRGSRSAEEVKESLADVRLSDLELMHDSLLFPAMRYLMEENVASLRTNVRGHVVTAAIYVGVFLVYLLLAGGWGIRAMLGSLKNTSFHTKSILAALPTDVIMSNQKIYMHLSESSRYLEANFAKAS